MKLRVRSAERKETIRVEIASSSTLRDLKELIIGRVICMPSISPEAVHLSLNRKEEIVGDLPEKTLETLGIASGDLIFYSLDPSFFSQSCSNAPSPMEEGENSMKEAQSTPGVLERIGETESEFANFLLIAVQGVFLESGFKEMSVSKGSSTVSVTYSLPEVDDIVELKFLIVGKFLDVYGRLIVGEGSTLHRLCLNSSKFNPEDEDAVFALWRSVKDELSSPILIEICRKNGLPPPPCFVCLPTEIKIKILELVSGADLARAACASLELRYLCSNEELWRRKFAEEFPGREADGSMGNFRGRWKDKFAAYWVDRKLIERRRSVATIYHFTPLLRRPSDSLPFPGTLPGVLGGDYDRFPVFGGGISSRPRRARPPFLRGLGSVPPCNFELGGFYA